MLYVADAVDKVDYNLLTTLSTILYPINHSIFICD